MAEPESLLTVYRILDLTDALAVYGTRRLADWGAEVIKVEAPDGDPLRREPPFYADVPYAEPSLSFLAWNTHKKSITLNLQCTDWPRFAEWVHEVTGNTTVLEEHVI